MRPVRRAAAAVLALALMVGVGAVIAAAPAGAQEEDPYGSTTTTSTPPGQTPSCRLRTASGEVGSRASVTVKAVARGTTVRLLFDGRPVAEAEATGPGNSPRINVDIDFTVPEAEPGMHEVTAVGADFSVSCRTSRGNGFEVVGDAQVLSAQVGRGDGGNDGGSSLPRTGIYLGLLVAVALGLVVAGRALLAGSKRRGRASTSARAGTGV
jgi:hypothetical protein